MSDTTAATAVIVLNPESGTGDHAQPIRNRASLQQCEVRETEQAGDAKRLAREAAAGGASMVVAAGGDGTLNEVVAGVAAADALDRVAVAVIPAGTGNNFATNVGIDDVDAAFRAIEDGESRRVDLGWANGRPFVNSCVGGLTADASQKTDHEMKHRLGVLAYFVTTIESVATYDELELVVHVHEPDGEDVAWSGEAIAVLAGNGRRFTERGSTQADLEDGLLEVTVVENAPSTGLLRDAVREQLFSADSEHTRHMRAPSLEIEVVDPEPMTFSLDGEILESQDLELSTGRGELDLIVGDSYEPDPDPA